MSRSLVGHINAFLREPPGPSAMAAGPKVGIWEKMMLLATVLSIFMLNNKPIKYLFSTSYIVPLYGFKNGCHYNYVTVIISSI